jgi:hypothetical protein
VYVGKLDSREIDFIGIRGTEKIYVQAVYLLRDNKETIDREFGAFRVYRIITQNMWCPWMNGGLIILPVSAGCIWRIFCWDRSEWR